MLSVLLLVNDSEELDGGCGSIGVHGGLSQATSRDGCNTGGSGREMQLCNAVVAKCEQFTEKYLLEKERRM